MFKHLTGDDDIGAVVSDGKDIGLFQDNIDVLPGGDVKAHVVHLVTREQRAVRGALIAHDARADIDDRVGVIRVHVVGNGV
jgi:hypothetical protein